MIAISTSMLPTISKSTAMPLLAEAPWRPSCGDRGDGDEGEEAERRQDRDGIAGSSGASAFGALR